MARLIPDSAFSDSEMTTGERKLLRALHQNLEDSCIVWYQPKLPASKRPDIIVYLPSIGLLLYEVKDWSIKNIRSANPDFWEVSDDSKSQKYTSPFKQVRTYYFGLNESCQREPLLLNTSGKHQGKVVIPIGTAVAFPNITKQEFEQRNLHSVIESKFILFKDELQSIGVDMIGKVLLDKLKLHFDPWWKHDELPALNLDKLRGILYPEITSKQKEKGGKTSSIILDEYQEQVAKKLGDGHRIVRGVAGSGKSLVLCAKIRLLLREKPDWKILLTCYNISLESQLRYYLTNFSDLSDELAQESQQAIKKQVEIVHFHDLCKKIFKKTNNPWPFLDEEQLRKTARFQNLEEHEISAEIDEMSSALLGQELQKVALTKSLELYDAIIVDESQDFHSSWLKSLTLLLNGKTNFLLLTEDPNQKIYSRKYTYKDAGIDAIGSGRIFNLPIGYRSTREIILTASKLVRTSDWDAFYKKFIEESEDESEQNVWKKTGAFPDIIHKQNYEDLCDFMVSDIKAKLEEGYSYQDFGIIYLTRTKRGAVAEKQLAIFDEKKDVDYIKSIQARLAGSSIPNFWLSQNRDSKGCYDQFRETVTLTTLFSAKGLEFEVVYVVGLELYPWVKRSPRENASMLYVAMTRAKERLYLLTTEQTPTVNRIKDIMAELRE